MDKELFNVFRKRFYNAKDRCINKNNKRWDSYGWRWIKCKWKDSEEFRKDMRDSFLSHVHKYWISDTTLDRIDVDWDYCKENCRWATWDMQNKNRRECREFKYNWIHFDTLRDLSKYVWINESTIDYRLEHWWNLIKALETPVREKHPRVKKEHKRKQKRSVIYKWIEFESIKDLSVYLWVNYNTLKNRLREQRKKENVL